MGHDEHGPAYPEPYECGVCGSPSTTRYLRCNHPMCPDGRDQDSIPVVIAPGRYSLDNGETWQSREDFVAVLKAHRTAYQEALEPTEPPIWQRLAMLAIVLGVLYWLFSTGP